MSHGMSIVALGASTLIVAWAFEGCADYSDPAAGGDADADSDADTDTDTDADNDCIDPVDVTPCGGDAVGTWTVASSCLKVSGEIDLSALGLAAECVVTVEGDLDVTGTWTAYADGTYADNTVTTGTETVELSDMCLSISPTNVNCGTVGGAIKSAGYASMACDDNSETGGCSCSGTIDQTVGIGLAPAYHPSAEGTYTTDDNILTFIEDEREYSYCVEENTLTLTPVSTGMTGTVTGSVVLKPPAGDADSDTQCTDATLCGGDLVGTWTVTSSDLEVSGELDMSMLASSDNCGASVSGTLSVTGTWTGYADGMYSDKTAVSGTETIEVFQECEFDGSYLPISCARLNNSIEAAGYASVDCIESSESDIWCTCTAVIDQVGGIGLAPGEPSAESPYWAGGGLLTIIEGEQEYLYNVEGKELTMTPVSTGVTGTITGAVVLQR